MKNGENTVKLLVHTALILVENQTIWPIAKENLKWTLNCYPFYMKKRNHRLFSFVFNWKQRYSLQLPGFLIAETRAKNRPHIV